jgi:hypothetical protein
MAVVSVKERHQDRRSSWDGTKWTHLRTWLVKTDDPQDGTVVAVNAVPGPGSTHNKDGNARLTRLDADPHDSSDVHFLVRTEYTSTGLIAIPADPLKRVPEIAYGYTDGDEPYFLDKSTPPKLVTTSAGDPFESYLTRETGELTISLTVNEPEFNPIAMDDLKHTTNVSDVTIDGRAYAAGTLKLTPQGARKIMERIEQDGSVRDTTYYAVGYLLKARKAGWHDKPLDIGLNELIPDANPAKPKKLKPIVDAAQLPVKKGWPLDGAGRKKVNPTDQPAELEFKPYGAVDWANLKFAKAETWQA